MDDPKDTIRAAELAVVNKLGVHARAAAKIAETAASFPCRITLHKDGLEAEADSVLAVLTLDAPLGTMLEARAAGERAEEAIEALTVLFADKFGEEQ